MTLSLKEAPQPIWQRHWKTMPLPTMQQDWAYGEAVRLQGQTVHRCLVQQDGQVIGMVQLFERRLIGTLSALACMRGPVWKTPETATNLSAQMIEAVRRRHKNAVLLWTPDEGGHDGRHCGLRRVMTGYTTIRIDLTKSVRHLRAALHVKWRNMLNRAETQPMHIERRREGMLVDWLIGNNEQHRRKIGYRSATPAFFNTLRQTSKSKDLQESHIAIHAGNPVAGVTLQMHGNQASYLFGYTSETGRSLRAHHRLLWEACLRLKEKGIRALDLGGVETVHAPGLARFKLGMGGELIRLSGTYLAPPRFGK